MHEIRRSVCPHDCPSQCALVVTVDDGRVTDVEQMVGSDLVVLWGINAITDDRMADMGGGSALHSNLVQVARL